MNAMMRKLTLSFSASSSFVTLGTLLLCWNWCKLLWNQDNMRGNDTSSKEGWRHCEGAASRATKGKSMTCWWRTLCRSPSPRASSSFAHRTSAERKQKMRAAEAKSARSENWTRYAMILSLKEKGWERTCWWRTLCRFLFLRASSSKSKGKEH
jgi:hypothetical protein